MVGGKISHFLPNGCCFHCWRPPSESLPNSSQFSPSVHASVCSQDQCFPYLNVPVGHLGTLLTSRFRLRRSRWAEGWHHKEALRCCSLLVGPPLAGAAGEWTLCRCLFHSSPFLPSLHKAGRGWSPALSCLASHPTHATLPTVWTQTCPHTESSPMTAE